MLTWGHEGLNWPGDPEGMISYLVTNTSMSTLQVKLMWVGKRSEKSNRDVTKSMGRVVWHMNECTFAASFPFLAFLPF